MNFPIDIGWPQFFLLLIALLGLGILYKAFSKPKPVIKPTRPGIGISILSLLLIMFALLLLWATFTVQTYLGLTGEVKVAHIHASAVANAAHQISVELTLYDGNNHTTSDTTYLLQGDQWMLQGDILKIVSWLDILGLHSGYKLTRLEGRYNDINLEENAHHTAIALNGGDDTFFKIAYTQRSWLHPFIDAAYGNAVFQTTGSFDIFATQDALIARQTQ
jgi:hypothetical protein